MPLTRDTALLAGKLPRSYEQNLNVHQTRPYSARNNLAIHLALEFRPRPLDLKPKMLAPDVISLLHDRSVMLSGLDFVAICTKHLAVV